MQKKLCAILVLIFVFTTAMAQQKFTVSGYVSEAGSKELLPGATIYFPQTKQGTTTNNYGFYSITFKQQDSVEVVFSYVGYQSKSFLIAFTKNIELNVELINKTQLKQAEVIAEHIDKVSQSSRMSVIEIPIQQIKDVPGLMGEHDALKVLQLMPGVQKGNEGNSGLFVRGGGSDQNLIILDDAPVYNAYHLFGFFSLFNGDALKSLEFTKGGFPARYGGRLSSVVDMTMKDGNKEKIHGDVGIGLIAAHLTLEGPLKKNKSSFLISARRTYIDAIAYPYSKNQSHGDAAGGYYFYDINAKLNYDFGDKNKLYLSGYFGRDKFYGDERTDVGTDKFGLQWGNATATLRWNHLYNKKLFSNTSLIFSNYQFKIYEDKDQSGNTYHLNYYSGIRDFSLKHDFDFRPGDKSIIKAGIIATQHYFTPKGYVQQDSQFDENVSDIQHITTFESAAYFEDDWHPVKTFRINWGVRFSDFYTGSTNYFNTEPRLAVAINVKEKSSIKFSYALMNQYIHQLSNSGIGLPTDLWVPSTSIVNPQQSQQVAAGYAQDFDKKNFALTVEGYYKWMTNVISYKEGASFYDASDPNHSSNTDESATDYENKVTAGKGWSYGAEVLAQRKEGKWNGWISYTLSWTYLQFDDLNFGKKFFALYDSRNNVSIVSIYKAREQSDKHGAITLSATWVYGTGNAITLPLGTYNAPYHDVDNAAAYYNVNGSYDVNEYSERNAYRMSAYHRLDVSAQFIRQHKKFLRTWELSIYNAYNRQNAYFYYVATEKGQTVLKQFTLFPILPSVSYNIKF